ncbi:DNA repair protein RecN [uncultured Jatrophihabitans sp.]|uniref:DNA repair protein RecN n=1 Tax=uncultured Jatrophihabitans sp. TaxID=1610747 RepID=UPI0035CA120B
MLDELQIRGLGVIDEAVLPLGPGLTAVTGETGAGKTMVVTALLLLFGARADTARIRSGAAQASVDGTLTLPAGTDGSDRTDATTSADRVVQRIRDAGGEVDGEAAADDDGAADGGSDDDGAADGGSDGAGGQASRGERVVVLRRVVAARGRSRAYVGGAPAPVSVLGELGDALATVHGQSDQLRLVRPAAQRAALDAYAGIDLHEFAQSYTQWRAAVAALAERTTRIAQLRREAEVLRAGLAEIEAVAPTADEPAELTALAARLGHADALGYAARSAHDALLGDADDPASTAADVSQLLAEAARTLGQRQGDDAVLDALGERLGELAALTAELGADLGAYLGDLEADPARLEQVEVRRAELGALVRKYCDEPEPSIAGVLRWAQTAAERLAEIDVSDEAIAALRDAVEDAEARTTTLAGTISDRRREAAQQLAAAVSVELAGLAMPGAQVHVEVTARTPTSDAPALSVNGHVAGVTADGADDVALLLEPHAGAPALPIGRGASGGELSRVMLALEVCLAATDDVATLVFDEIDAGVGGRAAIEVGRRLARLARDRQVLVVTHLPQVAAFADRQIVVDKPADAAVGVVTASDVRVVTGDERVRELARMLAGSASATARRHAAELLAEAGSAVDGS